VADIDSHYRGDPAGIAWVADVCVRPTRYELVVVSDSDFKREEAAERAIALVTNDAAKGCEAGTGYKHRRDRYPGRERRGAVN